MSICVKILCHRMPLDVLDYLSNLLLYFAVCCCSVYLMHGPVHCFVIVILQLQQAELDQMHQDSANMTALAAIGPRRPRPVVSVYLHLLMALNIGF